MPYNIPTGVPAPSKASKAVPPRPRWAYRPWQRVYAEQRLRSELKTDAVWVKQVARVVYCDDTTNWAKVIRGARILRDGPSGDLKRFETMAELVKDDEVSVIADWLINHSKTKLAPEFVASARSRDLQRKLAHAQRTAARATSHFYRAQAALDKANKLVARYQQALEQ